MGGGPWSVLGNFTMCILNKFEFSLRGGGGSDTPLPTSSWFPYVWLPTWKVFKCVLGGT